MTLYASEFLRRFLLHVLPSGFVRSRHYGFLSNRLRHEKVSACRAVLDKDSAAPLARSNFAMGHVAGSSSWLPNPDPLANTV
jgi:Putative transposase